MTVITASITLHTFPAAKGKCVVCSTVSPSRRRLGLLPGPASILSSLYISALWPLTVARVVSAAASALCFELLCDSTMACFRSVARKSHVVCSMRYLPFARVGSRCNVAARLVTAAHAERGVATTAIAAANPAGSVPSERGTCKVAGITFPVLALARGSGVSDGAGVMEAATVFYAKGLDCHVFQPGVAGYDTVAVGGDGSVVAGVGGAGRGVPGCFTFQLTTDASPTWVCAFACAVCCVRHIACLTVAATVAWSAGVHSVSRRLWRCQT